MRKSDGVLDDYGDTQEDYIPNSSEDDEDKHLPMSGDYLG